MWLPQRAFHGSRCKGNTRLTLLRHLGVLILCIQFASSCRRSAPKPKPTTTTTTTTPKPIPTPQLAMEYLRDGKISKFMKLGVKLKNWALNKPTKQSSSPKKTGASTNAVDGLDYTYSITKRQKDPWWMVDLDQVVLVYAVAITNIKTERKVDVSLELLNQRGKWQGMCDNIKGKTETTQYIRCRNKYQVRFLLIHLLQRNTFISIHEVEVYGKPEGPPIDETYPTIDEVAERTIRK